MATPIPFTEDHQQQLTSFLLEMRYKLSLGLQALNGRVAEVARGTDITIRHSHPADSTNECIRQEEYVAEKITGGKKKMIEKIDEALARVETGEYGYCSECEEPIPILRLRAVPFTDKCFECKSQLEKNSTIIKNGSEVRVDKILKNPAYA